MRKASLENSIITGEIDGKRERGKQHVTYLASVSKWMTEHSLGEIR